MLAFSHIELIKGQCHEILNSWFFILINQPQIGP
jgi:hypothetical protein